MHLKWCWGKSKTTKKKKKQNLQQIDAQFCISRKPKKLQK